MRAAIAIALGVASAASAQEIGFDAHGFVAGPIEADVRDPIGWVRPGVFSPGDVYVGMLGEYARRPLVQVITSELSGDLGDTALIADLAVANLVAGVAVHERLRVDLAFPLYALSHGDDGVAGPAPGDLRATVSTVFLRPSDIVGGGGLGLGASAWVDLPTGSPQRYLGRSGVAGGGQISATVEAPRVTLNGAVGVQLDPTVDLSNITGSDQLIGALGVAVSLSQTVGVTLEAQGAAPLGKNAVSGTASPVEARLALRAIGKSGRPVYLFGLGRALTRGVGAADLRAFVGISLGRVKAARPADTDRIGTVIITDQCPAQLETRNGYLDDDGCPDQLAAIHPVITFEGQPRAGSTLSITGGQEPYSGVFAPGMPGIVRTPGESLVGVASSDGCLKGRVELTAQEGDNPLNIELQRVFDARVTVRVEDLDGRRIEGAEVAWLSDTPLCVPDEASVVGHSGEVRTDIGPGQHSLVVDAPGYTMIYEPFSFASGEDRRLSVVLRPEAMEGLVDESSLVRVEHDRIAILEKVLFESGKAVIRPESFELLDQVAQVIRDNPAIGRIEVAGHTDSVGAAEYNLDLSQRRADAVRAFLLRRGVGGERVVAAGYGEEQPIADNSTEQGRDINRRVDFVLIDAEPTP